MKKAWVAPGIEYEVLSATAFNAKEGTFVDGYYLDYQECEWMPVFQES